MKKIKTILLIISLLILFTSNNIKASECTKEAAMQLGKIVYRESGADTLENKEDNFFRRLTVASVAINNANRKKGSNWYQKLYNLDNNNYGSYSSYKDIPYTELVDTSKQGEILYISSLVLTGKYNLPSNMYLQAEPNIVNKYGTVWTNIGSVYIGYEGNTISSKDVFGNTLPSNTVNYYKTLSKTLMLSDYSYYTPNTVCTNNTNITIPDNKNEDNTSKENNNTNNNTNKENNNTNNNINKENNNKTNNNTNKENNNTNNNKNSGVEMIEACKNPDILRIIYFAKILINIARIAIPIGLIIIGSIDFSKSVINSDEKEQKKTLNLFIKRIIYAIVVFLVPWIVEVTLSLLGDITKNDNWTECITNADSEIIEKLDKERS